MKQGIFTAADLALALRLAVLLAAILPGVLFLVAAGSRVAFAASLKLENTITSSTVRLGDIFDGLGEKADATLGPAPRPGHDMTLNARTLYRIARAHDIDWKPQSAADQIVLRAATSRVDSAALSTLVSDALKAKGVSGNFQVSFLLPEPAPELVMSADIPATAEVSDLRYDPTRGKFEAVIAAPNAAAPRQTLRVEGSVEQVSAVPVLNTAINPGTIISAEHIDWIDVTAKDLTSGTVLNAEDLLGRTPRRMITAGKPLRLQDLAEPTLVKRGETVTILLESGALTLTATGRALENGARGSIIRVANTASSRTVQATVTDERVVSIKQP